MLDLLVRGGRRRRRHRRAGASGRRRRPRRARRRGRCRRRTRGAHHRRRRPGRDVPASSTSTRTTTSRRCGTRRSRPSPLHGVTTVIGGNCGFSIAPLGPEHVDYVMRMMARVEGMPLDALEAGPAWDWRTFGEWLDRLDGRLAVNAGFLVGHSTMRRVVMGDDADDRDRHPGSDRGDGAAAARVARRRCARLLVVAGRGPHRRRRPAGAVTRGRAEEFLALAGAVRDHAGTTLEFIAAMGEIPSDRIELMADMSLAADRPLNWNLLGSLSPTEVYEQQLTSCDLAADEGRHGRRARAPRPPAHAERSASSSSLPGWGEVLALPDDERRRARCATPRCASGCGPASTPRRGRGSSSAVMQWELVELPDGRSVAAVAAERGTDPVDVLLDVVLSERSAAHDRVPLARPVARRVGRELAGPGRGVARRPGRARWLRRRRAPRRHVPRQLHDRGAR